MISASATGKRHSILRRVTVAGCIAAFATLGMMSTANAQNVTAEEAFQVVPSLVPPPAPIVPASVLGTVVTTAAPTTAAPTTAAPTTKAPVVIAPSVEGKSIVAAPAIQSEVLGRTLTSPAFTGSNAIAMALAGVALFGFGSVLVLGARRRTKTR